MRKLRKEFTELWKELGRDPERLDLTHKTKEELSKGIDKLKAIKMGFRMLHSDKRNHNLAIALLADTFGTNITIENGDER